MLDPDRQAHIARRDAGLGLVLDRKLRVRRARRMDRQAARIADIGDVVKQLQRIDELLTGIDAALQFETDQPAIIAAAELGIGAALRFAGHEAGIDHRGDLRVLGEMSGDRRGIAALLAHP